jgi:hypothetical protein
MLFRRRPAPAVVKWPCITHIKEVMQDGKKTITHPFLSHDNNLFDKLGVTHLVVDEPFLAVYGAVAQAWTTCATNMKKDLELDSTTKNSTALTFPTINATNMKKDSELDSTTKNSTALTFPTINAKTIKTRFNAYMKFAAYKKWLFRLTVDVMMKRNHAISSLLSKKCMKSTRHSWKQRQQQAECCIQQEKRDGCC